MWIIKWIAWVVVLLFTIYFAAENSAEMVYVKFFKWRSPELQLWFVMFLSFGAGMFVCLFGSIFKVLQLKTEVQKTNKNNSTLKKELDNLRNISIEEDVPEESEPEGEF